MPRLSKEATTSRGASAPPAPAAPPAPPLPSVGPPPLDPEHAAKRNTIVMPRMAAGYPISRKRVCGDRHPGIRCEHLIDRSVVADGETAEALDDAGIRGQRQHAGVGAAR